MEWSLESVRELVAGGMHSVRECEACALLAAGGLLLLFLWYCYRVGREHRPRPLRVGGGGGGGIRAKSNQASLAAGEEEEEEEEQTNGFAFCSAAECFRCSGAGESLNQRLYHSLQDYAKRYTWSGMGRVHKGVRDQGARRRHPGGRPTIQRPEVFFLPDLPSAPFFSREAQRHDVELLEQSFPALLAEFHAIYRQPLPPGWKANGTPRGQWWTYYLVNQGTPLALNVRRCPRAWRLLGQLRTFIANNVFGNACFSVLTPGALIAEHYGPTNVRLRCHLGLRVPPSCELVVGGEPQCWSEGSCLLFDDSFLHRAFHEGSGEDGPRVVFMVDLWHPNVAAAERQALDYIFTPGRLEDKDGK